MVWTAAAGVPTICGMRIPMATVVLVVADGMLVDDICRDLPELHPDDIAEAVRFAGVAGRDGALPRTR